MVAIKLSKLLSLRGTSTSIISGGSINHYDVDNDDDIQDAHNDLAASIANRELLLTAAAMEHTNNNNDAIRVLSNEIKLLRDEMRERFDVLEKKNSSINCDNIDNVDVSMMDCKGSKDKEEVISSPCMSKVEKEIVSPAKNEEAKDEIEVTSNQNKDIVVGAMATVVSKDDESTDDVEVLILEKDTMGVVVNDKQQEETLIASPLTRVLKRGKNKARKQSIKGKRRQKKKNTNNSSSVSSVVNPGYHVLTIFVTLINAIPTLLLMRRGKRLYMLVAFIAASYLFKGEINSFSSIPREESVGDDISTTSGGWFGIGSFIQGVRALKDCPEQYVANNINSYDVGSKVTIEEKVYECTESPCGWKIIGTCVGGMFLPSSALATQPTIQTLGVPVHFPSMMTSTLDTGGDGSDLVESESVPAPPLGRVRIHSTDETRQGLFEDDGDENTQATLYYPDYVLAKCVTDSSTIFDSNQSSATIEECCDQW